MAQVQVQAQVKMMTLNVNDNNVLVIASKVLKRLEVLEERGLYMFIAMAQSAALRHGEYVVLENILRYLPHSPYHKLFAKDCRVARRFSCKAKLAVSK